MTTPEDEHRCTATTTRRTRCRALAASWPLNLPEDPKRCGTHLTDEQRAARDAALEVLHPELSAMWETRSRLHHGAPACWSWPVSPEQGRAALESVTADGLEASETLALALLEDWQASRCGICGSNSETVADHDHATGLVRGLLCRSCNSLEGGHQDPGHVWGRYRQLPPTLILGIRVRYLDPYLQRHAEPQSGRPDADRVTDSPLIGIGL